MCSCKPTLGSLNQASREHRVSLGYTHKAGLLPSHRDGGGRRRREEERDKKISFSVRKVTWLSKGTFGSLPSAGRFPNWCKRNSGWAKFSWFRRLPGIARKRRAGNIRSARSGCPPASSHTPCLCPTVNVIPEICLNVCCLSVNSRRGEQAPLGCAVTACTGPQSTRSVESGRGSNQWVPGLSLPRDCISFFGYRFEQTPFPLECKDSERRSYNLDSLFSEKCCKK